MLKIFCRFFRTVFVWASLSLALALTACIATSGNDELGIDPSIELQNDQEVAPIPYPSPIVLEARDQLYISTDTDVKEGVLFVSGKAHAPGLGAASLMLRIRNRDSGEVLEMPVHQDGTFKAAIKVHNGDVVEVQAWDVETEESSNLIVIHINYNRNEDVLRVINLDPYLREAAMMMSREDVQYDRPGLRDVMVYGIEGMGMMHLDEQSSYIVKPQIFYPAAATQ